MNHTPVTPVAQSVDRGFEQIADLWVELRPGDVGLQPVV